MATTHDYLSTACWHELNDGRPVLHTQCRATCKTCDRSCSCPNHPEQDNAPAPQPWVAQARDIACRLLAALQSTKPGLVGTDHALHEQYRDDPALFWLRGEVQPPGDWTPPAQHIEGDL